MFILSKINMKYLETGDRQSLQTMAHISRVCNSQSHLLITKLKLQLLTTSEKFLFAQQAVLEKRLYTTTIQQKPVIHKRNTNKVDL